MQSMIPKKPAPDLIRGGTGFRKRSCSSNKLERDDDSKKSHHALARLRLHAGYDLSCQLAAAGRSRRDCTSSMAVAKPWLSANTSRMTESGVGRGADTSPTTLPKSKLRSASNLR